MKATLEPTAVVTPLETIEREVHEKFGDEPPSKEKAAEFIKSLPSMDGGATAIAIALAAFVLQGYQVYTERQRARIGAGGNCPVCGKPADSINKHSGRWECVKGHSWD